MINLFKRKPKGVPKAPSNPYFERPCGFKAIKQKEYINTDEGLKEIDYTTEMIVCDQYNIIFGDGCPLLPKQSTFIAPTKMKITEVNNTLQATIENDQNEVIAVFKDIEYASYLGFKLMAKGTFKTKQ